MPTTDVSKLASCTSCSFTQDLSNYWTAAVYFRAQNGTYKRVPQMANDQIGKSNGGLTIYYTAPGPNTTTAFKPVCFFIVSLRNIVHMFLFPSTSMLIFHFRGFGCFLVTTCAVSQLAWETKPRVASAAIQARILAATSIHLVWTLCEIPNRFQRHRVLVEFGQVSSSQSKLALERSLDAIE